MKKYDAIIIGAGIAGLTLGKFLSKDFEVLIIEKSVTIPHKTWLTKMSILENNRIQKYITKEFKKYFLSGSDGKKLYVENDYCSINEKLLCSDYINQIKDNRGVILFETEFIDYKKIDSETLEIKTSKGIQKCRLLIDCSGYDSKIATSKKMYKNEFFYNIYGEIYNYKMNSEEINMLSNYDKSSFFEAVPISNDKCVVYTFNITNEPYDYIKLRKENEKNIEFYDKMHGVKLTNKLSVIGGTIPLRKMTFNSLDNVFFFGDSGNTTPPWSGLGFSYIIKYGEETYNHIKNCLNNNTLQKKHLNYPIKKEDRLTFEIHRVVSKMFTITDTKDFIEYINFMREISPNIIDALFIGTINGKEYWSVIRKGIKRKSLRKVFYRAIKFNNIIFFIKQGFKCLLYSIIDN